MLTARSHPGGGGRTGGGDGRARIGGTAGALGERRAADPGRAGVGRGTEASLIKLLAQANRYWRELRQGQIDITRLAERGRISPAYVTRVLRLAFLSPKVIDALLAGRLKAGISAQTLLDSDAVEPLWSAQQRAVLPG